MASLIESLGVAVQEALMKPDKESADKALKLFLLIDALYKLLDELPGSSIRPVPQTLADIVRIANRMCRFVLDDRRTVIGTGLLVGPSNVLTAAHLFFEPDGAGKGKVIDADRPDTILVEFDTILVGTYAIAAGRPRAVKLHAQWDVDPRVSNSTTSREVEKLDFAIVRLAEPVGEEGIGGGQTRAWFEIPPPSSVPTVAKHSMIHTFQYLDRESLRSSIGSVKSIASSLLRMFYGASTLDSASGSGVFDDRLNLVGVHVAGTDEDNPLANQGLPLRQIAKYLEDQKIRTIVSPPIPHD